MSNIVKHTQFKNVVETLWNRAKAKFVSDITYDAGTKSLKQSKGGSAATEITKVVTKWNDLEYVKKYDHVNLLNLDSKIADRYYEDTTGIKTDGNWNVVNIPVETGAYTMIRKQSVPNAWKRVAYLRDDGSIIKVDEGVGQTSIGNGYYKFPINVSGDCKKIGISLHDNDVNTPNCMIIKNDVTYNGEYIPYNYDNNSTIIGKEVSNEFNPANTKFTSNTVNGVLKEIDTRFEGCVNKGEGKIVIGGHTALVDANVVGRELRSVRNSNLSSTIDNETSFFTCGNFNITGGGNTVITQITIGMDRSIPEGTVVTGVNVATVKYSSGNNPYFINSTDCIHLRNGRAVVYKITNTNIIDKLGTDKAITIDVDITLQFNQRLAIGAKGALWGPANSGVAGPSYSGNNFPAVGGNTISFSLTNGGGNVGSAIIHTEETSLGVLIKDIGFTGTASGSELVLHRANGDTKRIKINASAGIAPISPLLKPVVRVGERKSFVYDISTIAVPKTFSTSADDVLDVDEDLPVLTDQYPDIQGTKIIMEGAVWVKATGQRLDNLIGSNPITLPTSTGNDNIFVCIGAAE